MPRIRPYKSVSRITPHYGISTINPEEPLKEADNPRLEMAPPGSGTKLPEHHDVAYVSREDMIGAAIALREAARQFKEPVAEVESLDYD